MRKVTTALAAVSIAALPLFVSAPAANASVSKVGICHATGVDGKYVYQEVAKDGAVSGHAGASHQDGRDIIPAFDYIENKVRYYFEGQNLDKIGLLETGCKAPAEELVANPNPPKYVPATCARPDLPYGEVVVPEDKGTGVSGATTPALNAENTVWSTSYILADATEDAVYSWPANFNGTYSFDVVPITEDAYWVVDSKTGVGECVLPDTGAANYLLPVGGGLALLGLGYAATRMGKRQEA